MISLALLVRVAITLTSEEKEKARDPTVTENEPLRASIWLNVFTALLKFQAIAAARSF